MTFATTAICNMFYVRGILSHSSSVQVAYES